MFYLVLALLLGLVGLVLWMAGGVQRPDVTAGPIVEITSAQTSTKTDGLDVVVWNLAWGYGWGSEGSGASRPAAHFEKSIEKISAVLKDFDADVVLLQEIDFDSTRSHGVDQAKRIASLAGYRYVAYAESWTANWVPFPYWPIDDQFGRIKSGGAILSRFPLSHNRVERLEKPDENPFWYNLFYLFRFLQSVELQVGEHTVTVFNTHLDAFSRNNREAQATHVATEVSDAEGTLIFGGDLNSVPPESTLRKNYPDELETDHDGDRTVVTMRSIDGVVDTITPERFSAEQQALFTFPAHAPNRKLDHLYVSGDVTVVSSGVVTAAGDVSDHLPVFARLRFDH